MLNYSLSVRVSVSCSIFAEKKHYGAFNLYLSAVMHKHIDSKDNLSGSELWGLFHLNNPLKFKDVF